ncbi:hypothetical protein SODALDRAFT_326646 [Sodiomyces alkalinus F11]|uniref:Zn(2)-C6 fungal-type domain-containing protein n=1 Tax=Sodiomyces alkalinus (strain CBS 110278 / VKM F-3762 / F11) TaxID=1314773 RepID=A0A3N2Q6W3_SODAK|nr:hypothetical protein SODALDRAFT_326646 [Sodiomyces alkalinus F11]ROT42490.1 hypothetical protein SODALDRAFT_326646 [Sodiomyces alkalinus F11]
MVTDAPNDIDGSPEIPRRDDPQEPPDHRRPPKKRRRIVISCTECHRRKQKCDRELPCGNCKSRNKETSCQYETGAPTAKELGKTSIKNAGRSEHDGPMLPPFQSLSTAAANWGYSQSSGSTLGFLRRIENANGESGLAASSTGVGDDVLITKEKYKALIRQLPAKSYMEKLIRIYLREFNHNYYALDEDVFMQQLADWDNISFSVLSSSGPQGLSPDMRMYPALMFQVLATALLALTEEPHEYFDHLKYAGNMTFEDLATDYSDSGVAIMQLLGKRDMTLVAVQASFLRANFLKHMGKVADAWHAIGSAIKDAQETGMHRDGLDPKPASDSLEDMLENQWHIQSRRRLYMVLLMWDLHCAVVLGRPGTVDWRAPRPSLPIDAPIPKDRRRTPLSVRDEERDPPSPVTKQLASFNLMAPLVQVVELEQDGPCPKNYDKVNRAHELAQRVADEIPAYFRLENPDTRWDNHPDCWWLPGCRSYLSQSHHFNFIALHRPYVFHRRESRLVALRESIESLQNQMNAFQDMDPKSWRNFQLFFGSFDAVVLMASIHILFPKENLNLAPKALQEFQWTMERFSAMSERNKLAKAARGVLQAIYTKLRKAIDNQAPARSVSTISQTSISSGEADTLGSSRDSAMTGPSTTDNTPLQLGNGIGMSPAGDMAVKLETPGPLPSVATFRPTTATPDWGMSTNFDFSNVAPLFAIGDILYNDVGILREGMSSWEAPTGPTTHQAMTTPQQPTSDIFEGAFGGDSFWNLMNQYDPASI